MTISSQCLAESERNKFNDLRAGKNADQQKEMDKTLSAIVQAAIDGAGEAEAENIKSRIARALRQTFSL
jgi:hypothetical protein